MMDVIEIAVRAGLVGIGGTAVLDLASLALERLFGVPAVDWKMVGRWVGRMPKGRFVQPDLREAEPVPGEHALGWAVHYVIGAAYGLLLVAIWGADWLRQPSVVAPLILALALLVLPYFMMMPGMGLGVAGSKTPNPAAARLKSVVGHCVFGLGMYLSAWLMAAAA